MSKQAQRGLTIFIPRALRNAGSIACVLSVLVFSFPSGASSPGVEVPFPGDYVFFADLASEISGALGVIQPEISGHVLSIDDRGVFLNVGSIHGVKTGMRFEITDPATHELTYVQVDRVETDFSHALIVSGAVPDLLYGAEYIQDETNLRINLPQSVGEIDAHIFLGLADMIESLCGWKTSSVGNSSWRYKIEEGAIRAGWTYVCELQFSEGLMWQLVGYYTIVKPDGSMIEGCITYQGDWIRIGTSWITDDSYPDWYAREGYLPADAYAVECADINGDGTDEIVVGTDELLFIYRYNGPYLEPVYIHKFIQPRNAESRRGDMGYLGAFSTQRGWRFFIRGPGHSSTAISTLEAGSFTDMPDTIQVPVADIPGGVGLIMADAANGYHRFNVEGVNAIYDDEIVPYTFPVTFSFCATGNFTGERETATAIIDSKSLLWLNVNGEWTTQDMIFGAGLWGHDIDNDGIDEFITTSRDVGIDRLEFYEFENDVTHFIGVSPTFEGHILDLAFGDINGDGVDEPVILTAFGLERKIIF